MKNLCKLVSVGLLVFGTAGVQADIVHLDDVIIDGSACIGFNCVNNESFGFDTIRLKENSLRIRAQDTSNAASFPSNDWQLTFNDSANGGMNKFSVNDIDGGRTPFTIEAGAPSHSLYVDDGGRIGLGTSIPVVEMHMIDGDTPTLRLEQDGSSGFTAQTWDVAGNENNFFIRDATNGSTLPFRIFPGAPTNALTIEATTGDIGIGTPSPEAELHVIGAANRVNLIIENTGPGAAKMNLKNTVNNWLLNSNTTLRITSGGVSAEMLIWPGTGDVEILGTLTTGGSSCGGGCDEVFAPEFTLDSIEDHAAQMWADSYLPAVGPTEKNKPMNLTEKTGGILNELEMAHIFIEQLHARNLSLMQRAEAMEQRVQELERQNQRIEELVIQMVANQAEQVAIN